MNSELIQLKVGDKVRLRNYSRYSQNYGDTAQPGVVVGVYTSSGISIRWPSNKDYSWCPEALYDAGAYKVEQNSNGEEKMKISELPKAELKESKDVILNIEGREGNITLHLVGNEVVRATLGDWSLRRSSVKETIGTPAPTFDELVDSLVAYRDSLKPVKK